MGTSLRTLFRSLPPYTALHPNIVNGFEYKQCAQYGFARNDKSLLERLVLQGAKVASHAGTLALVSLLPNHVILDQAHFLLTTKALNFALHFLQGRIPT